jgi:NAD(P)-dependent dehydrogenase (short-subunit alcohol dehydrogenase family)
VNALLTNGAVMVGPTTMSRGIEATPAFGDLELRNEQPPAFAIIKSSRRHIVCSDVDYNSAFTMPTAMPKVKPAALSKELSEPLPEPPTFEGKPGVRSIAGDLGNEYAAPRLFPTTHLTSPRRVKGKVIIVTGANSLIGIGRASAHQFARHGARALYLCDYDASNLAMHKRELASLYPATEVHTRQFDAADEAAVKAVVGDALEAYGRLDVFFANAGISSGKVFWEEDAEGFMKVMRTNALSVFLAAKHGSLAMRKTSAEKPYPGGSIIGTASVAGLKSNAGPTDYSASKAAVVSLMQTCAYQLVGSGIRCNAVCPGLIETGMTKITYDAARARGSEKKIGQLNPLRRGGQPDEIARAVLFLASDESSYVNAQAWAVDGGLSGGMPFVPGKLA